MASGGSPPGAPGRRSLSCWHKKVTKECLLNTTHIRAWSADSSHGFDQPLAAPKWQRLRVRSGKPCLRGTALNQRFRARQPLAWLGRVGSLLAVLLRYQRTAEINKQRRTDTRVAVLGQAQPSGATHLRVLKRWLSAGPRRHGLPERTLKRCHFGAANGWWKPCDEVADQAQMCVVFKRHSLVTFLCQQESDPPPGGPGGLPHRATSPPEGPTEQPARRRSPTVRGRLHRYRRHRPGS